MQLYYREMTKAKRLEKLRIIKENELLEVLFNFK